MKFSRWVLVVACGFLLMASGRAMAQPFELDVQVSPERQEVLYPFNARVNVLVTDADTGAPVPNAKVHFVVRYSRPNPDVPGTFITAQIDRSKRTRRDGRLHIEFKTGIQWIGTTIEVQVRVREHALEGYDTSSVDVIEP